MTKEEYMAKLEAQFGGEETLIPNPPEETAAETSEETSEETTETQPTTEEPVSEEQTEETAGEPAAESTEETDEELVNPENGKKYSNKRVKKAIWENKHLTREVAELKQQLAALMEAQRPKEEEPATPPSRSQFNSDEEYINAAFAHNLKLLAQSNKAQMEEQAAAARFMEEKKRRFDEKIVDCIPESKREAFDESMNENFADLQQSLTMDAQDDIVSMSSTPLILWKLAQNPDLISAVNRMNRVERIMFCDRVAEQMRGELAAETAPKAKAPVLGKVGTGKANVSRSLEEMDADEMYAYMTRRHAGS